VGARLKPKQSSVWTFPPKLAQKEIVHETLRGARSKISIQPLGQPQMSFDQGCQNRNFASGRKRRAKSTIVKSQPKSKDFTQLLL